MHGLWPQQQRWESECENQVIEPLNLIAVEPLCASRPKSQGQYEKHRQEDLERAKKRL